MSEVCTHSVHEVAYYCINYSLTELTEQFSNYKRSFCKSHKLFWNSQYTVVHNCLFVSMNNRIVFDASKKLRSQLYSFPILHIFLSFCAFSVWEEGCDVTTNLSLYQAVRDGKQHVNLKSTVPAMIFWQYLNLLKSYCFSLICTLLFNI